VQVIRVTGRAWLLCGPDRSAARYPVATGADVHGHTVRARREAAAYLKCSLSVLLRASESARVLATRASYGFPALELAFIFRLLRVT
jgi:hypothetical protein